MMVPSDAALKRDIVNQLYWDDRVDVSRIAVTVEGGVATLTGDVDTVSQKRAALSDVQLIPGVIEVVDALGVPLRRDDDDDDDAIAAALSTTLRWNADLEAADIRAEVASGRVTLRGTVPAFWHLERAEELAGTVRGVREIENRLAVTPTREVLDQSIAEILVDKLVREPLVNHDQVEITVAHGVVRFTGAVNSLASRRALHMAALHTVGVRDVHLEVRIVPED